MSRRHTTTSITNPYLAFSDDLSSKNGALATYGRTVDSFQQVQKSVGYSLSPLNPVADIKVREEFSRQAYDSYRPSEALPYRFKDIVLSCRSMYKRVGIVRNVIDLMTDFTTSGLRFMHSDRKQQVFFQSWARKVNLSESVNEYVRHLLVEHNVVVKRVTARLSKPVENQIDDFALAKPDIKLAVTPNTIEAREIPWRYHFLDVTHLQWKSEAGAALLGNKKLAYKIPSKLISLIKGDIQFQGDIVENLPKDIVEGVKAGKTLIDLDQSKLFVTHCKKDSWDTWSTPFLFGVMPDVAFKDKLRQAEISALDGVINVIRVWKLGDHKEGILPNEEAVSKLINILEANTGGGAMDIVWDSMIDMKDYYPPIDKILGSEKYEQVNRDILIGLGLPEVLLGGKGSNFSNSSVQLKTITERLKYVREKVVEWLSVETGIVAKAMGFETLPRIVFDQMSFKDENVEKQLIVGLLDRGVISPEGVLEAYGKDFFVEVERLEEQTKMLKDAGLTMRGPFERDVALKTNAPTPSGGRPPGTKDVNRKERVSKPMASDMTVIARDTIDMFEHLAVPVFMEQHKVANARQLTNEQRRQINDIRVHVLACINPSVTEVTEETILAALSGSPDSRVVAHIKKSISDFVSSRGKEPTVSQRKTIESASWANYHQGENYEV